MGILENIFEKGKQIAQGIRKAIERIKGAIKFFMTAVRNYCRTSNTSGSDYCFNSGDNKSA